MKFLQIVSLSNKPLYRAIIRKQAEIHRRGRGTFSRAKARNRNATRWVHVRYKGSIDLKRGQLREVEAAIKSPDRGGEARLISSFLGWLDRHFGENLSTIKIEYRNT